MRFVPIERVEHGMMLAKSIYDYETRTLLREGKLLSDEIIVRIRERGYPGIYIEDEYIPTFRQCSGTFRSHRNGNGIYQ